MTDRPISLWLPAAILAALVPAFGALGLWQLHRADEKRAWQAEYDQRSTAAPLQLGSALVSAAEQRYRRVNVRGSFDTDYQILIDSRVHRGVPGYHVVTPLRLEGGDTRVLINRGWVQMGASRAQLPPIETPPGVQQLSGIAMVPLDKVFTLGEPPPLTSGWQPLWPRLDMRRYTAAVPFAVQPIVLLLDADAAHGYTREWSRLDAGIALHQGYAFQWFGLAALALVIMLALLRRAWQQQWPRRRRRRAA